MGAWGHETFENDDAADWLIDLSESDDLQPVVVAIDSVCASEPDEDEEGDLEAPYCTCALAAAEVVAALLGKPSASLPAEVKTWLKDKPAPDADLVAQASGAVRKILEDSELNELWKETEDYAAWRAVNEDLLTRLG